MSVLENFAKAIETGDVSTVLDILSDRQFDINTRLPRAQHVTALLLSIVCKRLNIAEILLERGALVDRFDACWMTACHYVASCFSADDEFGCKALQLLLKYNPNLFLKNASLHTALDMAINTGSDKVARILLTVGAPFDVTGTELYRFAAKSTCNIQALVDRDVTVRDIRSLHGETALHKAFRNIDVAFSVFNMLFNVCKIDLDVHDIQGYTCVDICVRNRNDKTLDWLICAGADVNCIDKQGFIPLHMAEDYKCAVLLLAAGAVWHDRPTHYDRQTTSYDPAVLPALLGANSVLKCTEQVDKARKDIAQVDKARKDIAKARINFVHRRALQVCIGLQALELPALQVCEILLFACGPVSTLVPFHQWWKIATIVKHFN